MATTNLLPWNPTAVNQETDAEYLADSQRAGGATDPSVFLSVLANKAFYQWSTYLTALFQAFAAKGFTTSDSNLSTLTAQCANFLTTADVVPAVVNVPYAATVTLNAATADGFYIQNMTGPLTIVAVNGLTPGQIIAMQYQQDSAGGRAVTFPSSFVGAVQPDPAPNAVSLQLFDYDANTGFLRAFGPLISANGAWFPAGINAATTAIVGGLLTTGSITLAAGAPMGAVLIGDGSKFASKQYAVNVVTGSRFLTTIYQNTTTAPMDVFGSVGTGGGTGTATIKIGNGTPPSNNVQFVSIGVGGTESAFNFSVPVGWYYQMIVDVNVGIRTWCEGSWS